MELNEHYVQDIPQVSELENEYLTDIFSESKVRAAVFQMEHNKAPGLDGFPPEFYQVFWDLVKDDLMALFIEFHEETLPLNSLNFGNIILILEKKDAKVNQQYRPICLLNVSFKIFSKAATNRLSTVA
jgi:hypothetical protein